MNPPLHVVPCNDLREHDTDGEECWCCPRLEDGVVIHNSADGREAYEDGRRRRH